MSTLNTGPATDHGLPPIPAELRNGIVIELEGGVEDLTVRPTRVPLSRPAETAPPDLLDWLNRIFD